jgi:hypothetical protein
LILFQRIRKGFGDGDLAKTHSSELAFVPNRAGV